MLTRVPLIGAGGYSPMTDRRLRRDRTKDKGKRR
jgi:hypothetical protein